jgi:hypothetical protein
VASAPVVFVIGTARSGTTALYELLCSHPDTTWVSNYSQRLPLAALAHPRGTDAGKHRDRGRWTVRPVEAYRTFDRSLRVDASGHLQPRSPRHARLLRGEIWLHRRSLLRGRPPVFVSKNTRNTRAIPTLEALFPGARYVHLVRHPVPTVSSLLEVDFFESLGTGWESPSRTFADAIAQGEDPVRLAARLWDWETAIAFADLEAVDPVRVLRVRYEDLMDAPVPVLRTVCELASLDPSRHPSFDRRAGELTPPRPRPADAHTIEVVQEVCANTARRVGYDVDVPAP